MIVLQGEGMVLNIEIARMGWGWDGMEMRVGFGFRIPICFKEGEDGFWFWRSRKYMD